MRSTVAHDNGPREHLAISGDGFDGHNSGEMWVGVLLVSRG